MTSKRTAASTDLTREDSVVSVTDADGRTHWTARGSATHRRLGEETGQDRKTS